MKVQASVNPELTMCGIETLPEDHTSVSMAGIAMRDFRHPLTLVDKQGNVHQWSGITQAAILTLRAEARRMWKNCTDVSELKLKFDKR